MERRKTLPVQIGKITIGNNHPIAIQSMTNTRTKNVDETIKQIWELEKVGCEIVRVAVFDMNDALAIKQLKNQIHVPLVADIHFDYRLALASIDSGIDKLRINPGNIGSIDRIKMVVEACKRKHVPIRIGINAGSLEKEILKKHQHPTAQAMIESAQKHVKILEDLAFNNIVLSLKASDVLKTVEAYQMASSLFPYPLHLGITEAGTQFSGTIKSSIGLGILINQGIGDTIRVSLSSDSQNEIKVAKEILSSFGLYEKPTLISCPSCGRIQYDMFSIINEIEEYLNSLGNIRLKVAVMGCAVNGPGEAMEADIGIAGGSNGAVLIKKGQIMGRIEQADIVSVLKKEIDLFVKSKIK